MVDLRIFRPTKAPAFFLDADDRTDYDFSLVRGNHLRKSAHLKFTLCREPAKEEKPQFLNAPARLQGNSSPHHRPCKQTDASILLFTYEDGCDEEKVQMLTVNSEPPTDAALQSGSVK